MTTKCEHNNMTQVLPGMWIGGTKKHTEPTAGLNPTSWKTKTIVIKEVGVASSSFFVCPNYGTPTVTLQWWIREIKAYQSRWNEGDKTLVRDLGGHGRSGMYCAIVMSKVLACTGEDAIERLRELHCVQCVETPAQELYVYRIANELKHAKW